MEKWWLIFQEIIEWWCRISRELKEIWIIFSFTSSINSTSQCQWVDIFQIPFFNSPKKFFSTNGNKWMKVHCLLLHCDVEIRKCLIFAKKRKFVFKFFLNIQTIFHSQETQMRREFFNKSWSLKFEALKLHQGFCWRVLETVSSRNFYVNFKFYQKTNKHFPKWKKRKFCGNCWAWIFAQAFV